MIEKDPGHRSRTRIEPVNNFINSLHPTPQIRIENPKTTEFSIGDIVRAKIGPATGRRGIVVVERNGNYEDREPYVDQESIGVLITTPIEMDKDLEQLVLRSTEDPEILFERAVRWFDSPDQLELVQRAG